MRPMVLLIIAAVLLAAIAKVRPPEYDEAYSIFLTAGDARPAWPAGVFLAGQVRAFYRPHATFAGISRDLRKGDVHPPLYFWLLEVWRRVVGPSWFGARVLSVAFSVGALAVVGAIAAEMGIPVLPAMGFTLFSYGFAYTGIVARGFALAQLLNVAGFYLVLRERRLLGGVAFGLAGFSNYLAVFSFASAFFLGAKRSKSFFGSFFTKKELLGLLPFLFLDFSYFVAQRHSRVGQFVAFTWGHALRMLVKDAGAAVFGGLPVYFGAWVAAPLLGLCLMCVWFVRRRAAPALVVGAVAPAVGLLGLGVVFGNTPIEIRYLSFGLPFMGLLLAGALPRGVTAVVMAVQAFGIAGLAFATATAQPQGLAARVAAGWPGALVLVPFGNDGVGVVGPVVAALPDGARVEVLRGGMPDMAGERAVVVATVRADAMSRAEVAAVLAAMRGDACFRPMEVRPWAEVFLNRCAQQKP